MNFLYILGNGFDKAQGLATSYDDFYNHYKTVKPASELEERVQREISSHYDSWADMEVAMGKYSAKFDNADDFITVIGILNSRLREYLITEESKLSELGLSGSSKIARYLVSPEVYLETVQGVLFDKFMRSEPGGNVWLNCVTFNYTKTFELAMPKASTLGSTADGRIVYLRNVLHIHGTLDDMILLGVNDPSQIANESFRTNEVLISEFVKPEINSGCENYRNETFSDMISNANVIVLFGASIGITDLRWWKAIGERYNLYETAIVYYPYNPHQDTEKHKNYKKNWSLEYIAFLKERMSLAASVESLRSRVFIGINKPFLKLI